MVTHVKNRLLHIDAPKHLVQSASLEVPKSHNDTLDCTLEEVLPKDEKLLEVSQNKVEERE